MNTKHNAALKPLRDRLQHFLSTLLRADDDNRLCSAMRYSVLQGGKRLRPLLVYATGTGLGAAEAELDHAAAAIELIHCFSLVHDDLPAMDNDDLRRGRPTCHKRFNEATAILAGDSLQTLAFETLTHAPITDKLKVLLIQQRSQATGRDNMSLGQQMDILGEKQTLSLNQIQRIHSLKTGALIRCAIRMGATIAHGEPSTLQALDQIGTQCGLAFQVQDDLLDVESNTSETGKAVGADEKRNKSTYPRLLGTKKSHGILSSLQSDIKQAFQKLPQAMPLLECIVHNSINRCRNLVK